MKKINARLDSISNPFNNIAPWFFRIALGIAFFLHGYKKLPAPFMMEEQHRMVTWFESIFIPMPEVFVSIAILVEILGGVGIILGGLIGLFASQAGHFITRNICFFSCNFNV
jgi:uncharacterized membrane protein YphA (DoxX/SURF4 family)